MLRRHKGGPGAARETGRLIARGEFIQYLDSDDVLLPSKIRVPGCWSSDECSDCDVSYGKTRFYGYGECSN